MGQNPHRKSYPQFEFRENARTSAEVLVTIRIAGRDGMRAKTGNISPGGFFVALPNPPPVGTMVKFALDLDGKVVRGFGEVAWIRLTSKSIEMPVGMGVRFRHLLDFGGVLLRLFLARAP